MYIDYRRYISLPVLRLFEVADKSVKVADIFKKWQLKIGSGR
jgi:hypothetical protein